MRFGGRTPERLTKAIFPPPAYSPSEETEQSRTLNQTRFAQPALGAAGYALFSLLKAAGIEPDVVAGHSYGEYVALCAAGTLSFSELMRVSEQRGRAVQETQGTESVQMVASRLALIRSRTCWEPIRVSPLPAPTHPTRPSWAGGAFLWRASFPVWMPRRSGIRSWR